MFPSLATLLAIDLRRARNAVKDMSWAVAAVAAVFSVLAGSLVIGAYLLFRRAFASVLSDPLSGALIARYVLELSFAVIFCLGSMSFVMSSFTFIFRSEENRPLAALPVEPLEIFIYRFAGATLLSAWPVFFIGLPALTALGVSLRAAADYYFFSLLLLALFVLFMSVTGALLSFVIAWFARRVSPGWLWLGELAVFAFILASLLHRVMPHALFTRFIVSSSAEASAAATAILALFSYLPSHPFVTAISAMLPFGPAEAGAGGAMFRIAVAVILAAAALMVLAGRYYLAVWQAQGEGGFLARPEDAPATGPRLLFPRLFRWKYGYLFEKEWLTLLRNPEDVSRAGFLLLLMFLYVLAMRGLASMDAMNGIEMRAWVMAFTFAAIGYFSLTLAMRFIYPSLSLEGRSAWVIWSSPLHIHELFSWKLFFWSALTAVPMLLAASLTIVLFGFPFWLGLFFVFAILAACVTLVSIALGQGSSFPDFHQSDPQMLATSPAGLAATVIGLAYLWVMLRYVRSFALVFLSGGGLDLKSAFGILIVSWAIIAAYWLAAPRRMEKLELP